MARPDDPDDDAALRWDDVDDASYDLGPAPGDEPETAAADAASEIAPHDLSTAPGQRKTSIMLVATGVFAGIYLAYAVAWVIGGLQVSQSIFESLSLSGASVLQLNAYRFAEFLALIATPLWFVTSVVLTRGEVAKRLGWLAVGLLVLAPWPFLVGLTAAGIR